MRKRDQFNDLLNNLDQSVLQDVRNAGEKEKGNGELLELRLLETGFLSRFQLNP
jgi:hypothetical protein